ncbi:hypothetical protein GOHSU_23_00450 [Gordonia hirsuta DSM 44140 = NBRC 16056]|uniref:DUF3556 domain-containing protein n=1 Tax=Gordonia hirsuta DSM 44140 = NBRC 16056 TaxID=1121927 RepID=L7L9U7_9ACTN|nr:DUF3556 domain-containing protein [Gordonia hirsuta]GAC57699.1 hypothetical protein GOHSU_23_00450 [Gordonia hirsuta DSM 44140 = NBRC 16056]
MGFTEGDFPPVDPATFRDQPLRTRVRSLAEHWVQYGFGTPKMVHVIYLVKIAVLYIIGGVTIATLTSGLNPLEVSVWWNQPIVYQKLVLWTMLLEAIGLAGSWGPLAGKFTPMTGGILFWLRPQTIRLPPWPDTVPGTKGDSRTVFDVLLYAAILLNLLAALLMKGIASTSFDEAIADSHRFIDTSHGLVDPAALYSLIVLMIVMGLRDKTIFLAARSEQYLPAVIFFAFLPFVDMIVALKLLIVVVWVCAGISKIGYHFTNVIPPMISNTPWIPFKSLKRSNYRNFPNDLRPSRFASFQAHVLGTVVEVAAPLVLLLSTNKWLTLAAVILMVCFHAFIFSTFPLAVPLEWNVLFAFATVFLFWGFPTWDGFGIGAMSSGWLTAGVVIALLFFPILGNLRPDLVSFLPSMRQYAGNWAAALWAFTPGAEAKLNEHVVRPAKNQIDQLTPDYGPEAAEITMEQTIAWRSLHSQGRGLFSVLYRELGEDQIDAYDVREAEFACNSLIGFNFGDGHLHDYRMIQALQNRCDFAPGEFTVVWVESQPIHKKTQEYMIIDGALGVIERGTWNVAEAVAEQPWLPNGPIPTQVSWRAAYTPDRSRQTGVRA